jgi:hypothetical protein
MAGYLVPPAVSPGNVLTSAGWNLIRDDLDFGMVRPIAGAVLGGSAASIDFSNIPATFAHLQLVLSLRSDNAAAAVNILMRFNNDGGANYDYQLAIAAAAATTYAESYAGTNLYLGDCPGVGSAAYLYSSHQIWLPDYLNAGNNKACTGVGSTKVGTTTGGLRDYLLGGWWRNSAAINRITIICGASANFVTGSRAVLNGMGST